jgi:NitT/TauT family transport system substrate-binding protein
MGKVVKMRSRPTVALLVSSLALLVSACGAGGEAADSTDEAGPTQEAAAEEISTVRLGFFPNFTHAPALVGIQEGLFKDALSDLDVTVTPTAFNAGPDAVTALFGGSLDITYIGPNPTVNAYVQSQGEGVRVIAGAASGGAALVVRPGIASPEDLVGTTLATPQLGNTQDVALRAWLEDEGLSSDPDGGGDVTIAPQSNSEGLTAFGSGEIDGAWVPEPWVTLYEQQGATVLVDEADLWPDGQFVTTNLLVRTEFLEQYPEVVEAVLAGHLQALELIESDPAAAQQDVNTALEALTGSPVDPDVLAQAWENVTFTYDPLPATLKESAQDAVRVGLLDEQAIDDAGGLDGLYDLSVLDGLLEQAGKTPVGG